MKKYIKHIVVGFGILSTLAFKIGDEIELTQFLNARSNPNFIKKSNIVKTLKSGTTGEISDIKRFYSGNLGFKMKITSGPFAGQTHWVYYNVKSPGIVLSTKKGKVIPEKEVNESLVEEENINSKLEEDTNGHLDPSESTLVDITDFPKIVQETLNETLGPQKTDCLDTLNPEIIREDIAVMDVNLDNYLINNGGMAAIEYTSTGAFTSSLSTDDSEITRVSLDLPSQVNLRPQTPFDHPVCGNKDSLEFQTCIANGKLEQINIHNNGPNSINPNGEYYINRHFNITFNDNSLSDSTLLITDNPNEKTSSSTYSLFMFFPRKQLPTVKSNEKEIEMTLATGEVVKFDAKTKQIISGVLSEGPMKTDARRKALPADIDYKGDGVIIRADRNNGLPMDSDENLKNPTVAIVSKKGHSDCKIPSSQLWYNDKKLGRILIKEEYATDEGLNQLLKSRCGFTIN